MKKIVAAMVLGLAVLAMSGCENLKQPGGNQMLEGSRTYNYALVHSQITGDKYYHISGWKEYGPEGGNIDYTYVGLEIQLAVSKDVIYYYEPNLSYVLTKNYNSAYGIAIE